MPILHYATNDTDDLRRHFYIFSPLLLPLRYDAFSPSIFDAAATPFSDLIISDFS